jgi:hypothetical protein
MDVAKCNPYGKDINLHMAESIEAATPAGKGIQPSTRRSSGSVRKSHLGRGAFVIEFAKPVEPMDMIRREVPIGVGQPPLQNAKDRQSAVDKYRTMERKGFRVTKDIGCLIPDEQYGTYKQGATIKGHQRTFAFFGHWCPRQGETVTRNEYGWPLELQVSHLCHRRSCCRVDHLVAEEQWRNIKRNFCGLHGECDCGNPIKCLRRYQMQDQTDTPDFCNTKTEVEEVLQGAPDYVIHGSNRFTDRDKRSEQRRTNQQQRKRKQALHEHKTLRKQSRLQKAIEPDAEEA